MRESIEVFHAGASDYAQHRPHYPQAVFDFIRDKGPGKKRAWDCGCGNGQAALSLSQFFEEVEATDISENQITHSKKHPKVRFSVSPAEETSFPDHHFDLICVAQALHWFDLPRFFQEVDRVLRPGGLLVILGYGSSFLEKPIADLMAKEFFPLLEPYWSPKNQLLWNKYRHVVFPYQEVKTPTLEMKQFWEKEQTLAYMATWSAYRRFTAEKGQEALNEFREKLEELWKDGEKKAVGFDFTFMIRKKPLFEEGL